MCGTVHTYHVSADDTDGILLVDFVHEIYAQASMYTHDIHSHTSHYVYVL